MIRDCRVYLLNEDDRIVKATWVQSDSLDSALETSATKLPTSLLRFGRPEVLG